MKLRLINIYLFLEENETHVTIGGYNIYPKKSCVFLTKQFRKHIQNALVQFTDQEDSVIYRGGFTGSFYKHQKRKFIDDILVIGSLLTGWNWELYVRKSSPAYPFVACSNLENLDLNNIESRFLANIIIWEWLYPHIKNPMGASSSDEINDLHKILNYILKRYWPNMKFNGKNIFHILRNQLAHSGRVPINRKSADHWMTILKWKGNTSIRGIKDYIIFFDKLTQVIVLKTLGIK